MSVMNIMSLDIEVESENGFPNVEDVARKFFVSLSKISIQSN